jgi:preprotein translocase subunit SecD
VEETNLRLIRYYSNYGTKISDILLALRQEADDAVDRALQIIRNRVDEFGVSEPNIQRTSGRRIIVELAGIKDPEQARNLIQNTALLEFNLLQDMTVSRDVMLKIDDALLKSGVSPDLLAESDTVSTTPAMMDTTEAALSAILGGQDTVASLADQGVTVSEEILEEHPFTGYVQSTGRDLVVPAKYRYAVESLLEQPEVQATIPNDGVFLWGNRAEPIPGLGTSEAFYTLYYLYREPGLTGGVITQAKANIGAMGGSAANQPVVNVSMNNEGSRTWARLSGANIGKRVAIVLDKNVFLAPVFRSKIPDGQTVIEGMESCHRAARWFTSCTRGHHRRAVSWTKSRPGFHLEWN